MRVGVSNTSAVDMSVSGKVSPSRRPLAFKTCRTREKPLEWRPLEASPSTTSPSATAEPSMSFLLSARPTQKPAISNSPGS